MKRTQVFVFSLFLFITLLFFNPIFKGFIPFPGDLLIGEYAPYNSYSHMGYAPGAYPNKGQDFDVIRLLYPGKLFTIEMLKKGEIPLWNPYIFSGHPQMASFQWGVFYPFNLLFFIFPMEISWTIYILLQPILAGFFTFLLLKEYKLSNLASIFGGIIFSFSSFFTVWMLYGNLGHTFLWLPLVLFLVHKIVQKADAYKIISLVLVLTLSLLAGYIQTTMYLFIFSFAYGMFLILSDRNVQKIKKIFYFSLIFFPPLFFAAVQILPTIELFRNSTRTSYALESFLSLLIPLNHLVTIFIPDFFGNPATRNYWLNGTYIERVSYVGVIPLFFAVFSLSRKPSKILLFYIFSILTIFLLVYDTFITRFLYTIYLPPILSTGVPSRLMFLFCFSLSILSAFGFDLFIKSNNSKKILFTALGFALVFLSVWGFIIFYPAQGDLAHNFLISKRNLIFPSAILVMGLLMIFVSLKFKNLKKLAKFGVLILTIIELFYFFQKITPFAPKESLYPQTPILKKLKEIQGINRSWGYGSGYIEANISTVEKIYSTDGYDALHLKWYGELLTTSKNGQILYPPPRSESIIEPGFGENDLKNNKFRQNLLNLLGVKYILHKTSLKNHDASTFPEDVYELIWQEGEWQVYENKKALPRFFLTSNYIVEKNKEKIVMYLANNTSRLIVLEEDVEIKKAPVNNESVIALISYSPNKVKFETNSKDDKLLFLSDTYDKGWRAKIDGNYAKIYKANYAFRAVVVQKGKHSVEFSYEPKSFDLGLKISLATILIGVFYLLFIKFRK